MMGVSPQFASSPLLMLQMHAQGHTGAKNVSARMKGGGGSGIIEHSLLEGPGACCALRCFVNGLEFTWKPKMTFASEFHKALISHVASQSAPSSNAPLVEEQP